MGIEPPFKIQSKGLGLNYAMENAEILRENGFTWYNGKKVRIPRYFREKLGIESNFETDEDIDVLKVRFHLHERELSDSWAREKFQFLAWLEHKGLPANKITLPEYRDVYERLFEHWYEMQIHSIAAQAERDFLKVRAMHKGAI